MHRLNKYVFLVILVIILNLFLHINLFSHFFFNKERNVKNWLKVAGYWKTGPIHIDNDDPSRNWSISESTYQWCTGSGIMDDPYIIENVTIDATNALYGMWVANSNVYFIIRHCIVYNANSSGIHLETVDNGIMFNITCFQNFNGIYIIESNWNSIVSNRINDNYYGISFLMSDNNIISGNSLMGNKICISERLCEGNVFSSNDCGIGIYGYNILILIVIFSIFSLMIMITIKLEKKKKLPNI